jgi:hypothetical protein
MDPPDPEEPGHAKPCHHGGRQSRSRNFCYSESYLPTGEFEMPSVSEFDGQKIPVIDSHPHRQTTAHHLMVIELYYVNSDRHCIVKIKGREPFLLQLRFCWVLSLNMPRGRQKAQSCKGEHLVKMRTTSEIPYLAAGFVS